MLMAATIASKNLVKSDNVPNAAITTTVFPARVMWTRTADFSIQVPGALLGGKRTFEYKNFPANTFSRCFNTILCLLIHRYMQNPILDISSVAGNWQ